MNELTAEQLAEVERVVAMLAPERSVLFITGAGMSADSGLPTYRGIGGLYNVNETEEGFAIEDALSRSMLRRRPEITWKYLAEIARSAMGAGFNRGHAVIAEMEAHFARVCTLTQNIDGFHRQAGTRNLIEIHGDMHDLYCTACDYRRTIQQIEEIEIPPRCPECRALVRPDVVLFGEMLGRENLRRLYAELETGFDVVCTIGTTSVFPYIIEPVLQARRQGWATIEINPGESRVSHLVDVKLSLRAAVALDAIWERYRARGA